MYKPSPHFPETPFSPSLAFVAFLDVMGSGCPNAERLPLRLLMLQQANLQKAAAKRLAMRRGQP